MKHLILICMLFFMFSCKENSKKTTETAPTESSKNIQIRDVSYAVEGKNYKSFAAFDESLNSMRPVVLVIPEWWGLTDYAKSRATQLAALGYFAMAVDFYGDGMTVDNPEEAGKLAEPFYKNPEISKSIFDAAKSQLSKFNNADQTKIAVIGYCFGGAQALNMARQEADLKGAVSFHGNLMTGIKPNNNKVPLLICNGADDRFVPAEEIEKFKKEMDSAKIQYTFKNYPNSLHAFTNPEATEMGKKFNMKIAYNKTADEQSWQEMKTFLSTVFK